MGGGKGPGRILAAGLVGLVLVAAIGLASRANTPAGGGDTRSISQDILLEYALLLLVALAVVVVPVAVYLFVAGRREEIQSLPARKNWAPTVLVTMIGLSVVAVLLLRYLHDHRGRHNNPISQLAGLAHQGTKTAGAVRFDWGPVIVVSTLMVLALGVVGWMIVQYRKSEPEAESVAEELVLALERTIADLRAEPDPRTAVIAAYAQMELALAEAGLPRNPAEAPREYLGRVLALGVVGWMIVQYRKSEPEAESVAEELVLALERTIADLRAEPDPRTAVIAAYAQMELALAEAGLPRNPAEAPREYLGRVLPEVGAQNRSVTLLTGLFERAKFSPHTIDVAMKEEAIRALESLRDDLRSAE